MGHKSASTTQRYVTAGKADLDAAHHGLAGGYN
jgi:hypothetical protein